MAEFDMQRVKNVHMLGIGGCGMSGIAQILHDMGFAVSGTDVREGANTLRLKDLGVKIYIGHDPANIRGADLVVFSSAVSEDNVELKEAIAQKIPAIKRAEMVSWILNQSPNRIAVAGTHGKTTTTAMLAKVLDHARLSPTYLIGCDMDYAEGNARLGSGKFAVTEADESDSSFLFLSPTVSVITNIEEDHMENFGNLETLLSTFEQFARKTAPDGFLVVDASNPNNRDLMQKVNARFITYSLNGESEYSAQNLAYKDFSSSYTLLRAGKKVGEVKLSVPGWQNILNSLAVFAIGFELGIEFNQIANALLSFIGARRRFQKVGEFRDILIVDDYAHHPTEIRATLAAARSGWPGRRILCIFQPHRYSRTMLLRDQFATAFGDADRVIISDIYPASEKPIPGISGKTIADAIQLDGKHPCVLYIARKEMIPEQLKDEIQEGDLILTMGAGDIYTVGKEILSRLKMKS